MSNVSGMTHITGVVQPGQKVQCPGADAKHPHPHTLKPGTAAVQLQPVTISGAVVKAVAGIGITMCEKHYAQKESGDAKQKAKKH